MGEKLSRIEEKVISFLSLSLDKNAQQIQRGIDIEDKNYSTVKKAIDRLEKKKFYVESKKGKSEKNVVIKFYKLSTRGVLVAFATNDEETLIKTLCLYKSTSEIFLLLKQFANCLKPSTAIKLLRMTGNLAFKYGGKVTKPEAILTAITLNAISGFGDWTQEEIAELAEAAMKIDEMKGPLKDTFELGSKLFSKSPSS